MSKDTYFKHDRRAPELSKDAELDEREPMHLRTEVYYSLGGPNWFSGGVIPRGIFVSFTPTRITGTGYSMILGSGRGRKMLLEELPRKNKKRGEVWAALIERDIDRISAAAAAQKWDQVKGFLLGSKAA